ncbi:cation-dependent mannose-6-phosphate receptor-like [Saccostrea echinata]|uniref:cation-dependent mannose-6-phosphate receptor-like n=1 Tax=Saccostrea echinata TaxID=191078 RepID=UPI002A7FCB1D|nr:cation-dependent mannose-6-phosphate receptor-like [Saccostrea echinata]
MELLKLLSTFVILVSSHVAVTFGQSCTYRDQCSCTMDDGSLIDLSSLGNQDQTPAFADSFASDGYFYSYNPCYSFIEGSCINAAACQISGDQSAQYQLGDATSTSYSFDGTNVHFLYSSTDSTGLTRNVDVTLICDQSGQPAYFAPAGEVGSLNYAFSLTTKCACPNGCGGGPPPSPTGPTPNPKPNNSGPDDESGISIGTILCIAVLALVVVYLVAGTVFTMGVRKSRGKEAIPNVTFWSSLPGLIKDGFKFTFQKIRPGYSSVK